MHLLTEIRAGKLIQCAAIVVTYHPTLENINSIASIAQNFSQLYVVDNNSPDAALTRIESVARENTNIKVHLLRKNLGLAAGLNVGAEAARAAGFSWAATFDQDTIVPNDFANGFAQAVAAGKFDSAVALFAPHHVHPLTGESSAVAPVVRRYDTWSEIAASITSGSIINLDVHKRLGGFAEQFFIDYVDYEYGFRLGTAGYHQALLHGVKLPHQVGERVRRYILGIPVTVNHHSPLRQYYIMRNRLVLVGRYGLKHSGWALRELFLGTAGWWALVLAGPEHGEFFRFGLRGMVHAFTGRSGQLS